MSRRALRIAFLLAAPLLIAACGVKGPLESPLQAQLQAEKEETAQPLSSLSKPPTARARSLPRNQTTTGAGTTSEAVVNTPAARENSALDWLIK